MYFLQRFIWWIVVISACTIVAIGLVVFSTWVVEHIVTPYDKISFLVIVMLFLSGVFAWLDAS